MDDMCDKVEGECGRAHSPTHSRTHSLTQGWMFDEVNNTVFYAQWETLLLNLELVDWTCVMPVMHVMRLEWEAVVVLRVTDEL